MQLSADQAARSSDNTFRATISDPDGQEIGRLRTYWTTWEEAVAYASDREALPAAQRFTARGAVVTCYGDVEIEGERAQFCA
jgi:hypothetical protein